MSKDTIVLDRWDSQIIWLSKRWIYSFIEENYCEEMEFVARFTDKDLLTNLWSNRCGIVVRDKDFGYVISHLLDMVYTLGIENSFNPLHYFRKFMGDISPYGKWTNDLKYTDAEGYSNNLVKACLNALNLMEVYDIDKDKDIIKLQPLEPHLLFFGLRERRRDED